MSSVYLTGKVRGLEYDLRECPDGEEVLTLIELDIGGERNVLISSTLKSKEYKQALKHHKDSTDFTIRL